MSRDEENQSVASESSTRVPLRNILFGPIFQSCWKICFYGMLIFIIYSDTLYVLNIANNQGARAAIRYSLRGLGSTALEYIFLVGAWKLGQRLESRIIFPLAVVLVMLFPPWKYYGEKIVSPGVSPKYFYEEGPTLRDIRCYTMWTKNRRGEWINCGWMGELTDFRGCFNEFDKPMQIHT